MQSCKQSPRLDELRSKSMDFPLNHRHYLESNLHQLSIGNQSSSIIFYHQRMLLPALSLFVSKELSPGRKNSKVKIEQRSTFVVTSVSEWTRMQGREASCMGDARFRELKCFLRATLSIASHQRFRLLCKGERDIRQLHFKPTILQINSKECFNILGVKLASTSAAVLVTLFCQLHG